MVTGRTLDHVVMRGGNLATSSLPSLCRRFSRLARVQLCCDGSYRLESEAGPSCYISSALSIASQLPTVTRGKHGVLS